MPTTGDDGHPPVVMPAVKIRGLLQGQKALVTGANSGIGKAVAVAMGRAGADVVVNYVAGPEQAEEVAETVRGFGVKALAVRADVSQEDQVQAMFARTLQDYGTVDIVVATAGLQRLWPFERMT